VDVLSIALIAIGLAMDAFAVSIANGIVITQQRKKSAFIIALFFAGFQMLMPIIGWLAGFSLQTIIIGIDHWIAFGLLTVIGTKMIYDSTKKEAAHEATLRLHSLLTMSIATSIDALMVGLSFAFIQTEILLPVAVIGLVTFLLSFVGFFFGCGLGRIFGNRIKVVGGLVLIAIGVRILIEHLVS
jgi:putative Mn2+ efflux pump MntP